MADSNTPATEALPPPTDLDKATGLEVLDMNGKPHSFESLYSGPDVASRVLVILVRHVFCGSCHAYLAAVSAELSPEKLKAADVSIIIIGCGDPALIESYKEYSSSPYPMYMDPSEGLYKAFGTGRTTARGDKSTYVTDSLPMAIWKASTLMLQHISSGLFLKAGKPGTIGGEFLYETLSGEGGKRGMTWCHRMENTTDHTSVEGLKNLLKI